jgi:hypothetical protein
MQVGRGLSEILRQNLLAVRRASDRARSDQIKVCLKLRELDPQPFFRVPKLQKIKTNFSIN